MRKKLILVSLFLGDKLDVKNSCGMLLPVNEIKKVLPIDCNGEIETNGFADRCEITMKSGEIYRVYNTLQDIQKKANL